MHKYENKFNFFLAKPISQMLFDDSRSIPNINLKDVVSLSDDTEYMNRIYRLKNSLGKEEIYERIRLIGGKLFNIKDFMVRIKHYLSIR